MAACNAPVLQRHHSTAAPSQATAHRPTHAEGEAMLLQLAPSQLVTTRLTHRYTQLTLVQLPQQRPRRAGQG